MSFEPKPGMHINLNGDQIVFTALEEKGPASVFVYAEDGKEGTVYKVLKGNEYYAWKVFFPEYQDKRLLKNTEKLHQFKTIQGLRVADRMVITSKRFPNLVDEFPELNYSVLMPWIQGDLWGNLMANGKDLKKGNYIQIAQLLLGVICNLESNLLAHCDLSNNNFIINDGHTAIELIDIEDMYAPDMPQPVPNVSYGTPGYRNSWIAQNGLWGPESDRFAAAILCAEFLTWHKAAIRKNRAGDTSYFAEAEIGQKSERFQFVDDALGSLHSELAELFKAAWFSEKPENCPKVCEWLSTVERLGVSPAEEEIRDSSDPEQSSAGKRRRTSGGVSVGIPPKMEIDHTTIDFGLVQHELPIVKINVENTGGSILEGNIEPAAWIETKPASFKIQPGDKRVIAVSLRPSHPRPVSGTEYRTPNALVVNTNGGTEVIGATFRVPKPPFYKTWFGIFGIFTIFVCCTTFFLGSAGVLFSSGNSIFASFWTATPRPTYTPTKIPTSTPTPNRQATLAYGIKQTSTARVASTASALLSCARDVAFTSRQNYSVKICDEFATASSDWLTYEEDDEWGSRQLKLSNEKYVWEFEAGQGLVNWEYIDDVRATDFELTVLAERIKGPVSSACYGLIFRVNSSLGNYYMFLVCDDGTYAVLMQKDGWSTLIDWTSSDAIHSDSDNQLTVVGVDNKFYLYINSQQVHTFIDNTLSSGYVGLAIQLNEGDVATFSFDNFLLRIP